MLRFITCLLFLLPSTTFAQQWKTFNDKTILFTAKYPADWVNQIKEGKRVFFTSPPENKTDAFFENINVSVSTNPEFGTTVQVKDLVQGVVDQVKQSFTEFEEESRTFLTWNGNDACEIVYSGTSKTGDNTKVRVMQRLCFYKTRLYLVTYTALKNKDSHLATAKQIINSIRFKP